MDNFLLQAVVDEVRPRIVGYRIGRIFQPSKWDLIVDSRQEANASLFIRTETDHLGIFLARRPPNEDNENRPLPSFAVQLRKALGSARVSYIEKLGDDRIVDIGFEKTGPNDQALRLAISLAGRSADIKLIEGSRIVGSLRGRDVGEDYKVPPPIGDRLDPVDLPDQTWLELIERADGDIEAAASRLIGFTPLYSAELAFLSKVRGPVRALRQITTELCKSPPQPAIYSTLPLDSPGDVDSECILASCLLEHLGGWTRTAFQSVSAAAETYYRIFDDRRAILEKRRNIQAVLRSGLKKHLTLRKRLNDDILHCQNADRDQRFGDILLANLHNFSKSGSDFVVKDYFEPGEPMIRIADQDTSDPRHAAEHYFKRAGRARRGLIEVSKRLRAVEEEISKIESRLREASAITSADSLSAFSELDAGPRRHPLARPAGEKKKREAISGVRRYRSSDGLEILVGRTDRDNDNLTLRVARSSDLWFHAADYPGSHVVLRNPQKKAVPPASLREAAELAAKFSQAKNDSKVAVNYCERKFVTKPKGFLPGQVRLSSFKTILVEPRESAERIL
jgi:predicted ribosome quality control (RQC) complex YloA/Tae2 family protein